MARRWSPPQGAPGSSWPLDGLGRSGGVLRSCLQAGCWCAHSHPGRRSAQLPAAYVLACPPAPASSAQLPAADVEVFRRLYEEVGLGWVYAITKNKTAEGLANK